MRPAMRPAISGLGTIQSVHVGRQPIYDLNNRVVAFELLFRGSSDAASAARGDASATAQVIINTFSEFGLSDIVDDRLCFVNVTRDFVVGTLPLPFGPEQTVLEILESVEVDDEVCEGVARLTAAGYRIALDDFIPGSAAHRLLPMASVVKLDMLATPVDALRAAAEVCRTYPNIMLLGEKVETRQDIDLAKELGCRLLQGYALSRPTTVSAATLSPSRLRQIELLTLLSNVDTDITDVIVMVSRDPVLSLRLLRVSNSAAAGIRRRISSVHEAVMLLGLRRVREWVGLMLLGDVAGHVDESQFTAAVARARMCQQVAESARVAPETAFTAGLLLGIADLLGIQVTELIAGLSITDDLVNALIGDTGRLNEVVRAVLAYERADLSEVRGLGLAPGALVQAYLAATVWSTRTVGAVLREEV
jgi:c-di-GMP-related signal transduction protein